FILVTLIAVVTLYLAIKIHSTKTMLINTSLMALLLGLATGTNPIVVSIVPALLWIMWTKRRFISWFYFLVWGAVAILAIIVVHLYIPIRAGANPFLNYWH